MKLVERHPNCTDWKLRALPNLYLFINCVNAFSMSVKTL